MRFYRGFDTVADLASRMKAIGIEPHLYAIVYFKDTYYGVARETRRKEVVVGREITWFTRGCRLSHTHAQQIRLPFEIRSFVPVPLTPTIAEELKAIDQGVEVYQYTLTPEGRLVLQTVTDPVTVNFALVLLGVTFHDEFYGEDELDQLDRYFRDPTPYYNVFKFHPDIRRINPFAWLVEFKDGTIKPWHFY